jgi:hypothetical protein
MGFGPVLTELERMKAGGTADEDLADALPDDLLARVGWWGPPEDAAAGFEALTAGLDEAIVRVVPGTDNGIEGVRLAMRSCVRPGGS